MELIIYAPKEDGFIKSIDWNFEDLKAEITEKASEYMDLVYSDSQIKEAKKDRADMNKFKKALDNKRKEVKKQVMDPYSAFEVQIKELIGIVDKAVENIDAQIKGYEEQIREKKLERCREIWKEEIGDLDRTVTFEKAFNPKWLNKTTSEKAIREEVAALRDRVDHELKVIGSDFSKYVFEMKEEYLKEFDFAAAMAVKQKLEETEQKKKAIEEQEKKRKEELERKITEEAQKVQAAGSGPMQSISVDENGDPVVETRKESGERIIAVTFRVVARETQFDALNEAIRLLRENSENVELLKKEVL